MQATKITATPTPRLQDQGVTYTNHPPSTLLAVGGTSKSVVFLLSKLSRRFAFLFLKAESAYIAPIMNMFSSKHVTSFGPGSCVFALNIELE